MTPFAFLGLRQDADEREIKRAYAARLRSVRPEQDPAGFQQLHAAYKAALAQAQARARNAPPVPAPLLVQTSTLIPPQDASNDEDDADEDDDDDIARPRPAPRVPADTPLRLDRDADADAARPPPWQPPHRRPSDAPHDPATSADPSQAPAPDPHADDARPPPWQPPHRRPGDAPHDPATSADPSQAPAPDPHADGARPPPWQPPHRRPSEAPPPPPPDAIEPDPPALPPAPRPKPTAPSDTERVFVPAAAWAPPPFDIERFFADLHALARDFDGPALTQRLHNEPAFWSLAHKNAVRQQLLARLDRQRPPMRSDCFDALLAFFDLDHVLAGLDAVAVQRLRRQLQLAWEMLPEHFAQLAVRLRKDPPVVGGDGELRRLLGVAQQPHGWRSILRFAGRAKFPGRFTAFVQRLSFGQPSELPASFDQRAIRFWAEAAQTATPTRRTFGMAALHALAWTLLAFTGGALLALALPEDNRFPAFFIPILVVMARLLMLGMLVWRSALNWLSQRSAANDPAWRFRLRLFGVPGLALAGAALSWLINPAVGAVPQLPALFLAFGAMIRLGAAKDKNLIGIVMFYLLFAACSLAFSKEGSLAVAGLACVLWGIYCRKLELYRRR